MKQTYLNELAIGDQFCMLFQVISAEKRETKNKQAYLTVTLGDKTGQLSGNKWGAKTADFAACAQGSIVSASGSIEEYPKGSGSKQLNLTEIHSVTDFDASDFIPVAVRPYEDLIQDVRELVEQIDDPYLNKLVKTILSSKDGRDWRIWPAAKVVHHAVKHGLLQHSVEVAQYARDICLTRKKHNYDENISLSLVIAGALLHDIGKVYEYDETQNGAFDIGVGGLLGHIILGIQIIMKAALEIGDGFNADYDQLLHIVAGHHQELAHGSPVTPMTPEALIVAKADQISSGLYGIWDARNKHTGNSVYAKTMHGYVYCPKE